jgi:hypothetical protein
MSPNDPGSAYEEFARALAFANLNLAQLSGVRLLSRQVEASDRDLCICAHQEFVSEIARSLRYPNGNMDVSKNSVEDGFVFQKFRPAYGIATRKAAEAAQLRIRGVLDALLDADDSPLITEANGIHVRLDVRGMTIPREELRERKRRGRQDRAFLHPIQVSVLYRAPKGYASLLFGVVLGAQAGLLNRLAVCESCTRYILAKTDRPIRFCEHTECRSLGTRPTGAAPTAGAAHKRKQRERERRWNHFARDLQELRPKLSGSDQRWARKQLSRRLKKGESLICECFPRAGTKGRAQAECLLAEAAKW